MDFRKRPDPTVCRTALTCFGGMVSLLALLAGADRAAAEDTEVRDFSVQVDGKPAGYTQLVINRRDDGTTVVTHRASAQAKVLITYSYSCQGTETWQNYRLLRLDNQCQDQRKHYRVRATLDGQGNALRVSVNNTERLLPADCWTSSFWMLPEARYHNQPIPLLRSDHGEFIQAQLHHVGTEQRTVAGQVQRCYHFRITGAKKAVDLWFDVHHRLVRQEFVEMGHRTVIELTNVRR